VLLGRVVDEDIEPPERSERSFNRFEAESAVAEIGATMGSREESSQPRCCRERFQPEEIQTKENDNGSAKAVRSCR
jgi:hypothetical protein